MVGGTNAGIGGGNFAVIGVTYPEGSTCTCTSETGTTFTARSNANGKYIFKIPYASSWDVTITSADGTKTNTRTITIENRGEVVTLDIKFNKEYAFTSENYNKAGNASINLSDNHITLGSYYQTDCWTYMIVDGSDIDGYSSVVFDSTGTTDTSPHLGASSSSSCYFFFGSDSRFVYATTELNAQTSASIDISSVTIDPTKQYTVGVYCTAHPSAHGYFDVYINNISFESSGG